MFVSRRIIRPHTGKTEMAIDRVHRVAGILSRHGARTRVARVTAGAGAGEIHLYASFPTMEAGTEAAVGMAHDSAYLKLMAEREANPAGDVHGPDVARLVMGEPVPTDRVRMQRTYEMNRSGLKPALELLGELADMMKGHPVNLAAAVPVLSADMNSMSVIYGFPDLVTFGKMVDTVGTSPEFQEILVRASEVGTLKTGRVLAAID